MNIKQAIEKILEDLVGRKVSLGAGVTFRECGIDSLTVTELVILTEERLGIEYGQSELTPDVLIYPELFIRLTEEKDADKKRI